jgi:hypothetical protein
MPGLMAQILNGSQLAELTKAFRASVCLFWPLRMGFSYRRSRVCGGLHGPEKVLDAADGDDDPGGAVV